VRERIFGGKTLRRKTAPGGVESRHWTLRQVKNTLHQADWGALKKKDKKSQAELQEFFGVRKKGGGLNKLGFKEEKWRNKKRIVAKRPGV